MAKQRVTSQTNISRVSHTERTKNGKVVTTTSTINTTSPQRGVARHAFSRVNVGVGKYFSVGNSIISLVFIMILFLNTFLFLNGVGFTDAGDFQGFTLESFLNTLKNIPQFDMSFVKDVESAFSFVDDWLSSGNIFLEALGFFLKPFEAVVTIVLYVSVSASNVLVFVVGVLTNFLFNII